MRNILFLEYIDPYPFEASGVSPRRYVSTFAMDVSPVRCVCTVVPWYTLNSMSSCPVAHVNGPRWWGRMFLLPPAVEANRWAVRCVSAPPSSVG